MNIKRKTSIILLAVVMLLTFMSVSAFAEGETDPVKPVSAAWSSGYKLRGVIGTDELINLETPDLASFAVEFSDGSTKKYTYKEIERTEGSEKYVEKGFYAEGEDPDGDASVFNPEVYNDPSAPTKFKEGENKAKLKCMIPYVVSGKGTDEEEIDYVEILTDVDVDCYITKPLSVEFVPAAGFTPKCYIGLTYLSDMCFYGKGNAFRVKYQGVEEGTDGYIEYTSTYYYAKGKTIDGDMEEGFFLKGNVDLTRFDFDSVVVNLKKGKNVVDLEYYEYVDELGKEVKVPFKVTLNVQKYDAYADCPVFAYTGKVIKPKFKVYNSEGNVISSKRYTVAAVKNKKMGWYDVKITFKKAYRNQYIDSFTASYGIGPKKPVVKKITAGKKSIKVTWKKLSKAQLKKVDKYYIEIAQDKNFIKGYKKYTINKKAIKKCKKVIKKLKKGKKYYVQVYAVKKIKQNGESFNMPSASTKTKVVKVK